MTCPLSRPFTSEELQLGREMGLTEVLTYHVHPSLPCEGRAGLESPAPRAPSSPCATPPSPRSSSSRSD